MSFAYSHGYMPQILRPTRVTEKSANLRDHIMVNCTNLVDCRGIWLTDVSDNFATFISLKSPAIPQSGVIKLRYHERNELNKKILSVAMRDCNWGNLLTINDPLDCYAKFSVDLYKLFDENFPTKT